MTWHLSQVQSYIKIKKFLCHESIILPWDSIHIERLFNKIKNYIIKILKLKSIKLKLHIKKLHINSIDSIKSQEVKRIAIVHPVYFIQFYDSIDWLILNKWNRSSN